MKDTHREITVSNKTVGLKYKYAYLGNCYIKSTMYKCSYTQIEFSKKNEVVSGKSSFALIGPLCTPYSMCLNIGF